MSLSSLQAQLAALNGSAGKHPGSSFATSKRHEEAVGRGLHFSVQHGHSIRTGGKFYQASILSTTAREAGDVPLQVLTENCQAALQQLAGAISTSTRSPRDASFLLDMIPKITGKDQAPHKTIQELLVFITTLLAEPGDANESLLHTPCWHVIEYLLRRYSLHVDHMEDLLWTLFPIADRFPAIFHRCLQLVDLASHPSYLWLRPYATDLVATTGEDTEQQQQSSGKTKKQQQRNNKAATTTTIGNHVPPRQLLAQNVIKRTDLLRRVCRLATAVAEWHDSQNDENNSAIENNHHHREVEAAAAARRGIGHVLSFTAALVVEGLAWLEKTNQDVNHREKVLRFLFPTVLIACEGGNGNTTCTDWRGWGYVVASVLAETMELVPKALATLTTHILKGGRKDTSSFVAGADAVAAVMAVLFPPRQYAASEVGNNKDACFLPLLSGQLLGCPILPSATRAFCQSKENASWVASALGYLHLDRKMFVAPFVAALVVSSLSDSSDDTENDNNFALALLREKRLASLWLAKGKLNLLASLACWIVKNLVKQADKCSSNMKGKSVLKAIHDINPASCEQGIGIGIQETQGISTDIRIGLRTLLDGVIILGEECTQEVEDTTWEFLPPRVAIEHADVSVRYNAIKRLMLQLQDDAIVDEEALVGTLLRRLASDDNIDVAAAACDALVLYFDKRQPKSPTENLRQELEWCLCAGYHWMEEMQLHPTEKSIHEIMCKIFPVCAHIAKLGLQSHDKQTLQEVHRATEFLVAHTESTNQSISSAAQSAMFVLFRRPFEKLAHSKMHSTTQKLLLGNFQSIVGRLDKFLPLVQKPTFENAIQRKCALAMISAAVSSEISVEEEKEIVRNVFSVCISLLQQKTPLVGSDVSLLSRGLEWCTKRMSSSADELLGMVVSLASLSSEDGFEDVISKTLKSLSLSLKDKADHPVPLISVLLEAATRAKVSVVATLKLISIVESILLKDNPKEAALAVLPALYLAEHSDQRVRAGAVSLIEAVSSSLSENGSSPWGSLSLVCEKIVATKSTSYMGGTLLISGAFSSCAENMDAMEDLRGKLLILCRSLAVGCTQLSIKSFPEALQKTWLEAISSTTGACRVVTHIVNAMDVAGEKAFPLMTRWKMFGHPLLKNMLSSTNLHDKPIPSYLDCIVRMLKGVLITDPTLIISSGPGQAGRRVRSYSFGRVDGISVLSPYPNEMAESIIAVFSQKTNSRLSREFASQVAKHVIASSSWQRKVFLNLFSEIRIRLAQALLIYSSSNFADVPEDFFTSLPLLSCDVLHLFQTFKSDFRHLSVLIEFVRVNSGVLARESSATKLCMALLELLLVVHSAKAEDERDFVTLAALLSARELLGANDNTIELEKDELNKVLDALLAMLRRSDNIDTVDVVRLASRRARSTVHELFVILCEKYPIYGVNYLIPAMLADMEDINASPRESIYAESTFARLVPTFIKHASSADLTMQNLFEPIIARGCEIGDKKLRSRLFHALANALTVKVNEDGGGCELTDAAVGGFVASYLSFAAKDADTGALPEVVSGLEEACCLSSDIISRRDEEVQLSSLLLLLQYIKHLLGLLKDTDDLDSSSIVEVGGILSPSIADLTFFPIKNSTSKKRSLDTKKVERRTLVLLIHAIAKVFGDVLVLPALNRCIRRSESDTSRLSLHIWQDLLVVQSASQTIANNTEDPDEKIKWGSVSSALSDARDFLQGVLPVTIFLASSCSIVKEGRSEEIRSRGLLLIADRALTLDPDSGEASLFLEIVPLALEILAENLPRGLALKHSALVAIEHIARSLHQHIKTITKSEQSTFRNISVNALKSLSRLLEELCSKLDFKSSEQMLNELICSAALTSGALVRVVGAQSLPYLRKLLGSLVECLQAANAHVVSDDLCTAAKLTQLSTVRALTTLVDTTPQFFPPYLPMLLSSSTALHSSLRTKKAAEIPVASTVDRFDAVLAAKVPARLLIPSSAAALRKCAHAVEKDALLAILKASIENASNSETVAQLKPIFVCVTTAFEHSGPIEERKTLVEKASALLLSLVLKLSEIQLRRIFASLTEWKGELDTQKTELGAERRYAYWTACGVLCKSLRSIFLPCMAMAVGDAISELELAVAGMRKHRSGKMLDGKKRRRLETSEEYGQEAMRVLQPLLACLESALQADANQGGSWVRSDDNQKYESLLEPLGRLLRARIPADFPLTDSHSSPYQRVVLGAADGVDSGSVCGCLTALAAAGGDERLWKPLNYAVLEACSEESRPEVRKGGLTCLLSLMKSLGEEYMVLLPECLPVLSELLEDPDEEVSGLSKEIVSLAEELIGESLEESLR